MQPERLGPYAIERRLGRGGMGSVYAGVDDRGQRAALKVLSPALAFEPGFRQRFDAEIESLKKLMHPGIVRLYGFGEHDDFVFYAMEFVDGPSLEDELRAGRRFSWRETAELTIPIARALRHAHDSGVIHRDIKPANLLLASDDAIKLSDFGIARLFGQRLTSSGGVMGTAEYMAPEQANAQPVTPRCDLYSLGCVMYAMLTGKPPFRADSMPAMLDKHRRETPRPVRELAPDTPLEMERIIERLLAKSPDDRYPTAQALARELETMCQRLTLGSSVLLHETPPATAMEKAGSKAAMSSEDRDEAPRGTDCDPSYSTATRARPQVTFRTVDHPSAAKRGGTPRWQIVLAALPTALILAALVALIVHLVRGPSIEERWSAVEAAAGDPEELIERERDVLALLKELPADDPRVVHLEEYVSAIALARADRRLARGGTVEYQAGRTAVQRLTIDALRLAESDPARATRQLTMIVETYGNDEDAATRQTVALAERELTRLRPIVRQQRDDHLAVIADAIERARKIRTSDPAAARRILVSLVARYGNEPWAAEAIEPARAKTAASPPAL